MRRIRFNTVEQQIPTKANIKKPTEIIVTSLGKWYKDELPFKEEDSVILLFEDWKDVEGNKVDLFLKLSIGRNGNEDCVSVLIIFALLFLSEGESVRERVGEDEGLRVELESSIVHVILRPVRERKVRRNQWSKKWS